MTRRASIEAHARLQAARESARRQRSQAVAKSALQFTSKLRSLSRANRISAHSLPAPGDTEADQVRV